MLTEDMMDDIATAIKDELVNNRLLYFNVGTGNTTLEDETNTALDAQINGSMILAVWVWNSKRRELTATFTYWLDAADPDAPPGGDDQNTNGETIKEMGLWGTDPDGSVEPLPPHPDQKLMWRHTISPFIKTDKVRFICEIVIEILIEE